MAETGSKIFDLDALTDIADNDVLVEVDVSDTTDSADGTNKKITVRDLLNKLKDGWDPIETTCVYSSADDPTFAFTITGDQTGILGVGMKLKLTQTTDKYFIITAISYSDPTTTVTVYGGTDYDLANATITDPFFSTRKAPLGFPLSPVKWTIDGSVGTASTGGSTSADTYYNVFGTVDIPVGTWNIDTRLSATIQFTNSTGTVCQWAASLATDIGTTGDILDTQASVVSEVSVTTARYSRVIYSQRRTLTLTTKDTYYGNIVIDATSSDGELYKITGYGIGMRAVCAYL